MSDELETTAVAVETQEESQQADQDTVQDAQVELMHDEAWMQVYLLVTRPEGGRDVEMADLRAALEEAKVTHGIDEEALEKLCAPLYGQSVTVARGVPAKDGVDGVCTELYPREVEKKFVEREDGSVDFRELGLIQDIPAGTTICELTPPTPGVDGYDTRGKALKGRDGVKAVALAGENTRMEADDTRLVSTVAGNLVFRLNRFCVETVYRVEDLDYDVGNITFSGTVQVNGDVHDGFVIKAGGDVILRGRVGNVQISAGGNILLDKGINGTGKALLETDHDLKAGFVENCNLRIGGNITANTIINCKVECEGDVVAEGNKGVIIGGRLTVFGSVKAKVVGNESNTLTVVAMGVTPKLVAERKHLSDQLEDVERNIDEMKKNVEYIERLVKDGRPVPPERLQKLKRTQIAMPITEQKRDQLKNEIAALDDRMKQVSGSTLTANIIYPPTKVSIGSQSTNVIETKERTRVYKSADGELVFGSA